MEYNIHLLQKLIQFQSVTPDDAGSLEYLKELLTNMGFECHIVDFQEEGYDDVKNLYARLGKNGLNFCFAGHVDVVPTGDVKAWRHDPFQGTIENQEIYGRGTVDMKGAIAAFIDAIQRLQNQNKLDDSNSISFLLTGDEEGIAVNGTVKVINWLEKRGEKIDLCLIGEPTSSNMVGDTIKIGARGSVTMTLEVFGKQGHVAYHTLASNPITTLNHIMLALKAKTLDEGNLYFQPSNLEFTQLFVDNDAENVIPHSAVARFNIRFGNMHTAPQLVSLVESICQEHTPDFKIKWHSSGSAFVTRHKNLAPLVTASVEEVVGIKPSLNTLGGTSDARFLTHYCQVLELGLLNETAHKVDEKAPLSDIETLTRIYFNIIEKIFSGANTA